MLEIITTIQVTDNYIVGVPSTQNRYGDVHYQPDGISAKYQRVSVVDSNGIGSNNPWCIASVKVLGFKVKSNGTPGKVPYVEEYINGQSMPDWVFRFASEHKPGD